MALAPPEVEGEAPRKAVRVTPEKALEAQERDFARARAFEAEHPERYAEAVLQAGAREFGLQYPQVMVLRLAFRRERGRVLAALVAHVRREALALGAVEQLLLDGDAFSEREALGALAALDSERGFEGLIERARAASGLGSSDDFFSDGLRCLADYAAHPARYRQVLTVLEPLLEAANPLVVGGAAVALGVMGATESAAHLSSRFVSAAAGENEFRDAAGQLGLALAGVGATGAVPVLRGARLGGQAGARVRYAQWLLSRDVAAAVAFLRDPAQTRGLDSAVAALVDLNAREAFVAIRETGRTLTNEPTRLAFEFGLRRLSSPRGPVPVRDRMVWLLGARHPAEVALGASADHVFEDEAGVDSVFSVEADARARRDRR